MRKSLFVFVLFILVFSIGVSVQNGFAQSQSQTQTSINDLFEIPPSTSSSIASKDVILLNQRTYEEADVFHIVGQVGNNSTKPANGVQIHAYFYDENNQFLDAETGIVEPYTMVPRTTGAFDVMVFDQNKIEDAEKYQIKITWGF